MVITVNTMTTMKSKIFLYMAMCLMLLVPKTARAQLGFDIVSVEAYINDHKEQRSLLLVRSTLEASNKLLHDYSSDANIDYKASTRNWTNIPEPLILSMFYTSLCVPV